MAKNNISYGWLYSKRAIKSLRKIFDIRIKLSVIVIGLIFLLANCTVNPIIQVQNTVVKSKPSMHTLSEKDNGATLSMAAGDTLKISLEGNITTGFAWEISQNDPALLPLQGEVDYQSEKTKLAGSGGTFVFTFKALSKGENLLKLIYHRSFEKDVPPEREYELIVKIE